MNTTRRVVLGIVLSAYLLGLGVLAGIALERMRFDRQRIEVLRRYDETVREWRSVRMALEKRVEGRQP